MEKRIASVILAAFMLGMSVVGLGACGEMPASGGTPGNETEQGGAQGGETNPGEGGTENGQQGGGSQGEAPEVRTTVTEEEWRSALRMEGVRNVTVTIMAIGYYGYSFQIDGNRIHGKLIVPSQGENTPEEEIYAEVISSSGNEEGFLNVYRKDMDGQWQVDRQELNIPDTSDDENAKFQEWIFQKRYDYNLYSYNEQLRQYEVRDLVITASDEFVSYEYQEIWEFIDFCFEDGKLVRFDGVAKTVAHFWPAASSISVTFSDYGTTNVTLPQVAEE